MISTESIVQSTQLAYRGDLAGAVAALGDVWPGIGFEPSRRGESDLEFARTLLICGILTIELGRISSVPFQAAAKDLLSKSCRLFGDDSGSSEALLWLANAYLWSGENRETVALADSILNAQTAAGDVVFAAGNIKGLAYLNLGDFASAENSFSSVEVFLEIVQPNSRGKFYLNRGMLYRRSGRFEAAISDYELAHAAFSEVGNVRLKAAAHNNLAGIYSEQGLFPEAHAAAQRALLLFELLEDLSHEAKVWDQIAQIFGKEGNYEEMARCSERAVEILSAGDHEGWLAEALITQGRALSHVGMARAQESLMRAIEICERQGDPKQSESATMALWDIVRRTGDVRESIRKASLPIERAVYEHVLAEHDGHVSPAARELGFNHQAFLHRLQTRFPDLLENRRPRKRRSSPAKTT